jgi:hypothetical protein
VLGVQALVFDIYTAARSEVIDCEIVEPFVARRRLPRTRLRTVMQPAIRHDVAVASVRRTGDFGGGPGP